MRVLLTAFDPFGGENINSCLEVSRALNIKDDSIDLYKIKVPTVFKKSVYYVIEKIEEIRPDIVILLGQAGGRNKVSLERIAINIDDARIKDNEGNMPKRVKQDSKGPDGIFSSLDIYNLYDELNYHNIPSEISNSAGTFVCNHLMYGILWYIKKNKLDIKCGFIHLPFLPEQILNKGKEEFMDLNLMVEALSLIIKKQVALLKEHRKGKNE